MSNPLKRKAPSTESFPVAKHAKRLAPLELFRPAAPFAQDVDMMDVDMDQSSSCSSTNSTPLGTPTECPVSYPNLQIYAPLTPPSSPNAPSFDISSQAQSQPVQLIQPLASQNRPCNCSCIPRLQLACATPDGKRTLWCFCDNCGAHGMVV